MNGSRAWTADRARAADIVNAEPPPDERGDSSGPQARYRCRAPGTGWMRAGAPGGRVHHRGDQHPASPALPRARPRSPSFVTGRYLKSVCEKALLIREFRVVYM